MHSYDSYEPLLFRPSIFHPFFTSFNVSYSYGRCIGFAASSIIHNHFSSSAFYHTQMYTHATHKHTLIEAASISFKVAIRWQCCSAMQLKNRNPLNQNLNQAPNETSYLLNMTHMHLLIPIFNFFLHFLSFKNIHFNKMQ